MAVGENVAIHDQGASFQPITLQLDPDMITHEEIQLATLLRLWHTDLGMLTGLTSPSDLVVLHIDRFVNSPSGRVRKLNTAVRFCWSIDNSRFSVTIGMYLGTISTCCCLLSSRRLRTRTLPGYSENLSRTFGSGCSEHVAFL